MLTATLASNDIEVAESLIVGLMLVAALVAIVVSRVRVPYTIALVVVGLGLGLSGVFDAIDLTSELILLVFLPPLLFEGAVNMDASVLLLRWRQVAVLAVAGTLISAGVIAGVLVLVPGMAAELAFVLAVMLAPTDPISVLAILKEHGVEVGLRTLLEGESIFNDALAIVLYVIALEIAFGKGSVTATHILGEFLTEVSVGVAVGVVVGMVVHRLMMVLDDHLVEITLSLVAAYGSYLTADRLGGSGVIAVVGAALLIGNYSPGQSMSTSSRAVMIDFWEVLAFLANSALFLLIGLEFDVSDLRGRTLVATLAAIVAMQAGRAVTTFGLLLPFRRSATAPVPGAWRPAAFWGGLRGSIPIALVLGLPQRRFAGIDAVTVVFGVVLFSLLVQGLTYRPLLERLGLTQPVGPRPVGPAST
jgi:CPA1 family monovalent cation:H+ antiporter